MHEVPVILRICLEGTYRRIRTAGRHKYLVRHAEALRIQIICHHVHGTGSLVVLELIVARQSDDRLQIRRHRAVCIGKVLVSVGIEPSRRGLAVYEVVHRVAYEAEARIRSVVIRRVHYSAVAVIDRALILAAHQLLGSAGELLILVPQDDPERYDIAARAHRAERLTVLGPVEHSSVTEDCLVVDVIACGCISLDPDLQRRYLAAVGVGICIFLGVGP